MENFVRRFAHIDSKTPDKTALVCEPERLTYRQLDRYSENLAKLLARNGVGKEQPVGIMVKRCELFPICTLAVLKAGFDADPARADRTAAGFLWWRTQRR
ncbi:AMP-binding protein [Ruminococcus sp. FC2018]|uniref:AMP-binding protein n=1 Tax=Ruminococcus sp. FC2018 TaxID=1410617 RepID=UPI00049151DF|nr:AMP-binding protein [Ruminococcus sp. FC2018]